MKKPFSVPAFPVHLRFPLEALLGARSIDAGNHALRCQWMMKVLAAWLQAALEKGVRESVPALWDAFQQSVDDLFAILDRNA